MTLSGLFRTSLEALSRNRMRTLLSMLGIIIGVASVVGMLAIGEGSKQSIRDQITSMGTNMIMVMPIRNARSGVQQEAASVQSLQASDVEALLEHPQAVARVSPIVSSRGRAVFGSSNWPTSVQGVSQDYLDIRGYQVESGTMFGQGEVERSAKVCLLGKTVVDNLFPGGADPLGQWIRFDRKPIQVVGVLAVKGANTFGQDQDDVILMPWTTVQRRILTTSWLNSIQVSAVDENSVEAAVDEVSQVLRQRRDLGEEEELPFQIRTQKELLETIGATAKLLTVVLTSIAAISLLVGGIGIMNILLVSVTERTREIGLRMALGARRKDILAQFLLESILVSLVGGAFGILAGFGIAAAAKYLLSWPVLVTGYSIVMASAVCMATGVFFGWYPARKASLLDPIEALRHE